MNSPFQSLIFAWTFWMTLTLGCFGLMLLHHTVRGSWGYPILRLAEAGSKLVPIMGIVYLILFFLGKGDLYPWTKPGSDHVLIEKAQFMSWMPARTIAYIVIWSLLAMVLNASSKRQDQTGDSDEAQKRTNIGAPGLVLFVLTLTFAMTDWVMSLEKHWYSTLYGFLFLDYCGLAALSFITIVVTRGAEKEPYKSVVNRPLMRDLGNLLLTFTMVWGYFNLSQFLIQWSGNLTEETTYYLVRNNNDWRWMGTLLIFGQFFLPFLLLLSNRTKRTPRFLLMTAGWIFFMRIVDMYWLIIPTYRQHGPGAQIGIDLAVWAVFGAVWLGLFNFFLKQNALFPKHEPYVQPQTGEALEHA